MYSDWIPRADLTSSGRPVLLPGEVERYLLPAVDLEPEEENTTRPTLRSGILILTSHRLLWVDEPSNSAHAIPLAAAVHAFPPKKSIRSMFHSPRIRIQVSGGARSEVITVVMRGKSDPDVFYGRLCEVVRSRSWEAAEMGGEAGPGLAEEVGRVRMPVVGVSGILRKEQEMWESTDKSLQDAFQDLDALMSKAKEMVMLAERMRLKLLSASSSQANANDEEMGSKQEMQDWLLSVGIQSPVTKESAGALYHQQLSRQLGAQSPSPSCDSHRSSGTVLGSDPQETSRSPVNEDPSPVTLRRPSELNRPLVSLADFVKLPLEKAGGMIALIDVYCLFNRARGTELISPEDLLQACALWEKFDVPIMLRKFDSGVMAVQNRTHSDEKVFASITSLAQRSDALRIGISPSDAALTLGIAPALAKEHLLSAESKGLLCRDVSPDGFRFYINLFKEIDQSDIHSARSPLLQAWISAISASG